MLQKVDQRMEFSSERQVYKSLGNKPLYNVDTLREEHVVNNNY